MKNFEEFLVFRSKNSKDDHHIQNIFQNVPMSAQNEIESYQQHSNIVNTLDWILDFSRTFK